MIFSPCLELLCYESEHFACCQEAEGGKDETHRVLTGEDKSAFRKMLCIACSGERLTAAFRVLCMQEIVSELFRLQPGTALNFSDLATTEKAPNDRIRPRL